VISHYRHLVSAATSPIAGSPLAELSLAEMIRKQVIPSNLATRMMLGEPPEAVSWAAIEAGDRTWCAQFSGFHLPPEVWRGGEDILISARDGPPCEPEDALARAWANIEQDFVFVGLQDRLDEHVQALARRLQWSTRSAVPSFNQNERSEQPEVSPELYRLIEAYNRLDRALYERVAAREGALILNEGLTNRLRGAPYERLDLAPATSSR
jgi:Galactose-3-O-sulfotransferase